MSLTKKILHGFNKLFVIAEMGAFRHALLTAPGDGGLHSREAHRGREETNRSFGGTGKDKLTRRIIDSGKNRDYQSFLYIRRN